MARSVTASQPRRRCDAGAPGRTVSTLFSSMTPWSAQGDRSPLRRGSDAHVGDELGEDVGQRPRQRAHVRLHGEGQAHRVPGRGVRVLADDEHAHVGERSAERPEHGVARREVLLAGGDLVAQELAGGAELRLDGGEGDGPVGGDELVERRGVHAGEATESRGARSAERHTGDDAPRE